MQTDELPDDLTEAMGVWREAVIAYGGLSMEGETERLAARVIATAQADLRARIVELEGGAEGLS